MKLRALAVAVLVMVLPALGRAEVSSFQASFAGTFTITFGLPPALQDDLVFFGGGTGSPIGPSGIEGHSTLEHSSPLCERIIEDAVTITDASGDQLFIENNGEDCIDLLTFPGHVLIRGTAAYTILGGSGAYSAASGTGIVEVNAEVTSIGIGSVSGTFDPLVFDGTIGT